MEAGDGGAGGEVGPGAAAELGFAGAGLFWGGLATGAAGLVLGASVGAGLGGWAVVTLPTEKPVSFRASETLASGCPTKLGMT